MGTVSDLITEITAGFDVAPADALTVLNRRHKTMCRRARWHRMQRTLTATNPANAAYSSLEVPRDTVEVFALTATVNGSRGPLVRAQGRDRGAILGGTLTVQGPGGVFIEEDEVDASALTPDTTILIYPRLADDALTVFADGAFTPPALTTSEANGGFVRINEDFHEGLLAGVYASLQRRPSESRPDLAADNEKVFSDACGELRDLADRRFRTRGPKQIRTPLVR